MREQFPGYSKKTKEELKELWTNSIITFDANVLLDLYRYSKETREAIIELISKFKDSVFLTYQAALEYNRNRYEVISEQEKSYNSFIDKINQIESELSAKSKPPFLSDSLHDSIINVFQNVKKEVESSVENFNQMEQKDQIFENLSEIFEKRITENFPEEKLEEIYSEGKSRYEKGIPPGYKDIKKNGNAKYGDLILWKQILEKAKSDKKSVILITNEKKEDWIWQLKNGKVIGPRQELVAEMRVINNLDFHIYSSEKFLRFGQDHLQEQINKEALKEMETLRKSDEDTIEKLVRKSEKIIANFQAQFESELEILEPIEADILRLNMGYGDLEPMSIKEIAETFDTSPKRIAFLKEKALKKILRNKKPKNKD